MTNKNGSLLGGLLGKSKTTLLVPLLIGLLLAGTFSLVLLPNMFNVSLLPSNQVPASDNNDQSNDQNEDTAWRPSTNARNFVQGGYLPWYQGSAGMQQDASLGVYVGRAGGQERFGMMTTPMIESSSDLSSNMSTDEVLALAKSHPKVSEFLEKHVNHDEWAFFDGEFWHVDFYDLNDWEAWAYVMISDENREIVQIYIVDGEEVYLEWPNADLGVDDVIDIILADSYTTEFMNEFNLSVMNSWIWFDGEDTWYVSFWGWYLGTDSSSRSGDGGVSTGSGETVPSDGAVLDPLVPESDLATDVIFFPSYWFTDLVSDDSATLSSTVTNYYNFTGIQHSREVVQQHVMSLNETKDFMKRNENTSFIGSDDYLEIIHGDSDQVKINWWFNFYAWPNVFYIIADAAVSTSPDLTLIPGARSSQALSQSDDLGVFSLKNSNMPVQSVEANESSLPDDVVNIYTWTFDYLTVAIDDATLETTFLEVARQPRHEAVDVISELIATNSEIQQFVTEMEEVQAYLSFDPFVGTWYVGLSPTWTYWSYLWATVNDTDLSLMELDVYYMPEDLRPQMSVSQVKSLISNMTIVAEFNDTYSAYGDIITWTYYYPEYWSWYDVEGNDSASPGTTFDSNNKVWEIWIYSEVILEAWLVITINDTTGEIISIDESNPWIMPTLYPDDVLNITNQLQEVINFTEQHSTYDFYLAYYSGTWYISYSYYQLDTYAYVYVVIDDATAQVTEIYVYP